MDDEHHLRGGHNTKYLKDGEYLRWSQMSHKVTITLKSAMPHDPSFMTYQESIQE